MTRLGRMAAGARNILHKNESWGFTECRMKLKKFLYGNKYQTHECLAESLEKKVKKYIGRVQGSSRAEVDAGSGDHQEDAKKNKGDAGSGDHQEDAKKNKGTGILPLLSNVMVVEGAAEMGLKGVGKIVSVRDKSLTAGAAEIGNSMLGLDGIETMENVKQILSIVKNLECKMDAEFQRMDHKIEEEARRLELLIKSRCGGGGPRPPQSGSGGDSGSDEDGGFDIGD